MNGREELAEAKRWAETYADRMGYPTIVVAWPGWRSEAFMGAARAWWTRRPRMVVFGAVFAAFALVVFT